MSRKWNRTLKLRNADIKKFMTVLLYCLIGLVSSMLFFLALYWALLLDSTITTFVSNTGSNNVYLWAYLALTLLAIILFGVNMALLVYRFRKFGWPQLNQGAGTGVGSLLGIVASSCPVCGSTILATLGIIGGLAVFPLRGLELKALSAALLILPLWLLKRDLTKLTCGDETCPTPKDHLFKSVDKPWLLLLVMAVVVLVSISWNMLKAEPIIAQALYSLNYSKSSSKIYDEVAAKVLPERGFQSKISLEGSVPRLVESGVIDKTKFEDIYKNQGGLPEELKDVLDLPSNQLIFLTKKNASFYVNILWPIGLANYISTNRASPISGDSLFSFASTGGWDLGKEANGGAYFNKFKIVELTAKQEAVVTKIAQNTYRPCCNNSTFFQDCNHGSALLGLLELGASQGLSEDQLYREALAFNSFWFPENYIQAGLYFKAVKNTDWEKVDPKVVLGKEYSSASGSNLVQLVLAKIPNLLPQQASHGGGSCGT